MDLINQSVVLPNHQLFHSKTLLINTLYLFMDGGVDGMAYGRSDQGVKESMLNYLQDSPSAPMTKMHND